MNSHSDKIAFFVSPHGFGHAARACAVISALHEKLPSLQIELFSHTPSWFFEESLDGPFSYRKLMTDIGLVQTSPLEEDLDATIVRLNEFLPFDEGRIGHMARQLKQEQCRLIVCDIAPLGIAVGERANIPTVLIENFTWNWIYEGYTDFRDRLDGHIRYLEQVSQKVSFHIHTEPNCCRQEADLTVGPISRKPRQQRQEIRGRLQIPDSQKLVLITMGGIPDSYRHLEVLHDFKNCCFLIPGDNERIEKNRNLIKLPYQSDYYHTDLVHAADVVIGKVGYSTLAEVYHAGVPFGYFTRSEFRESEVLSGFIKEKMQGVRMTDGAYIDGSWTRRLPELLDLPKIERREVNGADHAADFIKNLIALQKGVT